MSGLRWWCVFVLCLSAFVQVARADGKAFVLRAQDPGSVRMPDQQALICFDNGIETLAIETRFVSEGTDFAWVIPLPAEPTIEAATEGLFPMLQALFQPRIIEDEPRMLAALVPLILGTLIVIAVPRWKGVLVSLFFLLVAVMLFLPSLGTARGGGGLGAGGVEVLSRTIAGEFELTTIASEDPAALVAWLNEGGYAVPEGAAPVIADYVAKGWVFVAAKAVAPEALASGAVTPRPLVFRFPVDAPVYPMRLTGVENGGPLELELFVFGPASAKVAGMEVSTTLEAYWNEPMSHGRSWPRWSEISVSHAGLQRVLSPAMNMQTSLWATHLRGELQPEQMTEDLRVEFHSRSSAREEFYTRDGRRAVAMTTVATLMLIGLWVGLIWFEVAKSGIKAKCMGVLIVAVLGSLGGVGYAATLPVTDSSTTLWRLEGYRFASEVTTAVIDRPREPGQNKLTYFREAAIRATEAMMVLRPNVGGELRRLREGDGPGQYEVRQEPEGGWVLVWHDWYGVESVFPLPEPEPE